MSSCEMKLFTSIGPVELVGHPVDRQTCWALQTGVHHHLDKQDNRVHIVEIYRDRDITEV